MAILGAGPAGLAVGYYARKSGLPFSVYEAADDVGGMCRTVWQGRFGFDCGAHRFHTKDPDVTREIVDLMGAELRRVESPSQVYLSGTLVDFPLSPLDLVRKLGVATSFGATADLVRQRLRRSGTSVSFEDLAVRRYGRPVARRFLLDYSEKLWGLPASELSPLVAGARLRGLDLKTFLMESFGGRRAKTRHLDGAFLYPRRGFGRIVERLADACGRASIHAGSRITDVPHDGRRILGIAVDGGETISVERLVSTLPIGVLVSLLRPAPPAEILDLARSLRFRSLALVVLFIDRPSVTANASVYFPAPGMPFTRLYEPKNRSGDLAPDDQTAIVAEIPHYPGDEIALSLDAELGDRVAGALAEIGWIEPGEVLGSRIVRLPFAYPILDVDVERRLSPVIAYLAAFANLHLAGRSSQFQYTHLHDLMGQGRDLVASMSMSARAQSVGTAPRSRTGVEVASGG